MSTVIRQTYYKVPRISYVIVLTICFFTVSLLFLIPSSYAQEDNIRDKINSLKTERNEIGDRINELIDEVKKQKETNLELENDIGHEKENLRELRRNDDDSWDSIKSIYDQKITLNDKKNELEKNEKTLQSLIKERLDGEKKVKIINDNIIEINYDEVIKKEENDYDFYLKDKKYDPLEYEKLIGVKLSSVCIIMIKNNINSTCPTYELLYQIDSSNLEISGHFEFIDNMFQRTENKMSDSWHWYTNDDNIRIIVDPPTNLQTRIRMIEIMPNLDTYTTIQSNTLDNNQRVLFSNGYVEKCNNVKINSDSWLKSLPNAIYYLRKDCNSNYTSVVNIELIPMIKTEIDITTSPYWQQQQWFKESKILCKQICKEY